MNQFSNSVIKTTMGYLYHYISPSQDELQIIDPFSCMIRLAMLDIKPIGTKISIYNHRIYFHDPSAIQGAIRWVSGSTREQLHYLKTPIIKAMKDYSIQNKNIEHIFKMAIGGLNKLKTSYNSNSSGIVCHSIELYISIIDTHLNNKEITNNTKLEENFKEAYLLFKQLWNDEQITLIDTLLKEADKNSNDRDNYIEAIESILKIKEQSSYDIVMRKINGFQ
jgi:hypothetical protein